MLGLDGKQRGLITALALLLSVFMAGALTAMAVITVLDRADRAELERPMPRDRGGPGGRDGLGRREAAILDRLTESLDLSEEQGEQIAAIFSSRERRAEELMGRVRDQLRAMMDSVDTEIESVLTAEQVDAYRRLRADGRNRLERRFPGEYGRRPPPDGRRPPPVGRRPPPGD